MDTRPIGLFDSGVGGLSVLKQLQELLPNEEFIYLGDTKNFPYGNKSKETIIELSKNNTNFLLSKKVKMVIVACGTATSQSIDILKKEYDIPIIGIIDPTISYLKDTYKPNETIGVIATTGTIKSGIWEKKIKEELKNVSVINEKAPLLAIMAEEGWTNNEVAEYTIKEYMKNFINIDKLILGCTHYPMFEKLIEKELPVNTEIINTGDIVARYVKEYLDKKNMKNSNTNKSFTIYLTDQEDNFKTISENFLETKIDNKQINIIDIT